MVINSNPAIPVYAFTCPSKLTVSLNPRGLPALGPSTNLTSATFAQKDPYTARQAHRDMQAAYLVPVSTLKIIGTHSRVVHRQYTWRTVVF